MEGGSPTEITVTRSWYAFSSHGLEVEGPALERGREVALRREGRTRLEPRARGRATRMSSADSSSGLPGARPASRVSDGVITDA